MPSSVVIEIEPGAGAPETAAPDIRRRIAPIVERHGGALRPGSSEAPQSSGGVSLSAEAPDFEAARRLADALRDIPGVAAAYPKPPEALP